MIGRTWIKWAAGAAVVVTLAALPAVGQARVHYTGRTPSRIGSASSSATPVRLATVHHSAKRSVKLVSHKKHKMSAKHATAKKLHSSHKPKHHGLSSKAKKM